MKKLLLLGWIFVISVFSTSCNYNQVEDKMVITKNDTGENNISGMGIDYQIKNITKGKYNVSLYSKEYTVMKILKQKPNLKKEYLMKYDIKFLDSILTELREEKEQKEIQEMINQ